MLGTGNFLHLAAFPFDANGFQTGDFAFFADELFGRNSKLALATFFVRGRCAQLDRPVRPGHGAVFFDRGLGHQLELGHAGCAMAVTGAHAVAAGVAAADDDDMLALSAQLVLELVAGIDFVLLR